MARPEVPLATFRRSARWLTLASVVSTVAGLYAGLQRQWLLAGAAIALGILCLYWIQRLQIRAEAAGEDLLVFVSKEECSLCDEARLLLPQVTEGTPFRVEEVPLEEDPALRRAFRDRVPVLLWQGEVLADLRWDAAAIRERLQTMLQERTGGTGTKP